MIITILDNDIEIRFISEEDWGHESYGDFDDSEMIIRIKKGQKFTSFLNTLCHELVHMKQYLYGYPLLEDEANRDALFWASFLKNSPTLKKIFNEYNK